MTRQNYQQRTETELLRLFAMHLPRGIEPAARNPHQTVQVHGGRIAAVALPDRRGSNGHR